MRAEAYAVVGPAVGTAIHTVWNEPLRRASHRNLDAGGSRFGDIAVVLFLVAQCLDGIFTYVGVAAFGIGVEANPLIASLMMTFGHGAALTGAKSIAAALGICLHLRQVHGAVALLTLFYFAVAIVPWTAILFF
jgi:hypothetical protein